MKYGTEAYKIVSDEVGGNSKFDLVSASHGGSPKAFWNNPKNLDWLFEQKKTYTPIDPYPGGDYTEPLNPRELKMIRLTAEDHGYYYVVIDGEEISQHTTEREAVETAGNAKRVSPEKEVHYEHRYKVLVDYDDAQVQP